MKVWMDPELWLQAKLQKNQPVALTIGNFDGVHRGHQELLRATTEAALNKQGQAVLLTFHPHPAQILAPEKQHVRLFSLEDQQEQLEKRGLHAIVRQPFSREFSEVSAPDFLEHFLLKYFQPFFIAVGHDFRFGSHRQGNLDLLQVFCEKHKIKLQVVPALKIENEIVSTSKIRQLLLQGEPRKAEQMLGRPYYLKGVVEKGASRGRQLGFPTANIKPDVDFYPRMGVYMCEVIIAENPEKKLKAVMNLGMNRTFVEGGHQPVKAEVHILDFTEDLYGQTLKVELSEYLREEQKFPSIEALKQQITADIQKARLWSHQ